MRDSNVVDQPEKTDVLLDVRDLRKWFPINRGIIQRTVGHVQAVDGISFQLHKGETLGVVGESGCGKSTAGRVLLRLLDPTGGQVIFEGQDLAQLDHKALRTMRKRMQIIFQDPYSSLNPRRTVGSIVAQPITIHNVAKGKEVNERVEDILERVGLNPVHAARYPHQFSGGQRQRIGIARAIAANPDFIVCDEPVSALDVSIQAQIVNLLQDLQNELGLSYIFIAHDLSVVRSVSDRVAVMYLGKMVEIGSNEQIYEDTLHPYTMALMSAVPRTNIASHRESASFCAEMFRARSIRRLAVDSTPAARTHSTLARKSNPSLLTSATVTRSRVTCITQLMRRNCYAGSITTLAFVG